MPYANKSDRNENRRRYRAAPENQAYREKERRRLKERHARERRDRLSRRAPMAIPVPGPGPRSPLTPEEKDAMRSVYISSETGCWLHVAYVPDAHDDFLDGRAKRGTTRWIYELFVGPVPIGLKVQRICGLHACVNPAHLTLRDHRWKPREIVLPVGQELTCLRERFEAQVRIDSESHCWLWAGTMGADGYGSFRFDGKLWLAHRVAYEIVVGHIPEGLVLDHVCYNRGCVNPAHLEPVTSRENTLRGIRYQLALGLEPKEKQLEAVIRAELARDPHLSVDTLALSLGYTHVNPIYELAERVRAELLAQ